MLNRVPGGVGDEAKAKISSEEYERLRDLADRRLDEINVLRNQLEQKDAAIDVIRNNYESQVGAVGEWTEGWI
jgi:hypothetical protein